MKILICLLLLLPSLVKSQIITTYAGSGSSVHSGEGGLATNAGINRPMSLCFDNNGNLLIGSNGLISRVNALTNIISTIGGASTAAIGDGGPATDALISEPRSLCVDKVGNLYIADYWANTVRKIDVTTNIITRYAGLSQAPSYSGDGGPATSADLNSIFAICIDTASNVLYLTDTYNFRVRRVDMNTGIITTFAGTGTDGYTGDNMAATNTKISRAVGLCLDKDRNLYIGDWDNARIRKVDITTGIISTFAGSGISGFAGDNGPATNAKISVPSGMCFDTCGNFFFSDCGIGGGNYRIRKIDGTTGIITTVAGTGTNGYFGDGGEASNAQFSRTNEIRLDSKGNLYIADIDNNRVRKVSGNLSTCYPASGVENVTINQLNVYPNPTSSTITLTSTEEINRVNITNSIGQTVYQQQYAGKEQMEIDVAHLPPGVYMVSINGVYVRRFLKE